MKLSFGDHIILYLIATVIFFSIDLVWLGVVAKDLYRKYLGGLLLDKFDVTAAVAFYAIFLVGVLYFAVIPALQEQSISKAAISGALFGLITYATYDLTNQATLKHWPKAITLIDMTWGTILTMAVSVLSYMIFRVIR